MSYKGATVRLCSGALTITSESLSFSSNFNYGDNTEFLKFFVLSYLKFLDDSPCTGNSRKPVRVYRSFLRTLLSQDLREIITKYADLSHVLLSNEYTTGTEISTDLFDSMKDTPIFWEFLTWHRTRRPEILKYIISFLTFGKKLEYVNEDFDTIALRDWYKVEEKLSTLTFSSEDISNLRTIVSAIFDPVSPDFLLPKFGPGKVSERSIRNVYDKLGSLSYTPKLEYIFGRERPNASQDQGFPPAMVESRGSEIDYSRLKFVPKDIRKSRSICMEPNSYMFFQQEVMRWLVKSINNSIISRYVNLSDQQSSRDAAMHGSTYLSTDTIDLSSASDSVHIDLVRGVFDKKTLIYLLGTRTSKVLPPDRSEPISVYKFAPMGSAVCFPVQCILFTAICLYGYLKCSEEPTDGKIFSLEEVLRFIETKIHSKRDEFTPFTERYEPPVVYGDDIAVDSRASNEIISILNRLGFSVNRSKSFTGSQTFRESCGVFAFGGADVTPVLFRLPFFKKGRWDAKVFASFIGSINWNNDNGYYHLSSFYLSALKDYGYKYPLPFTDKKDSFGIFTKNKHLPKESNLRWNADWQILEEVVQGIVPVPLLGKAPEKLELYRLQQWWRSRVRGYTDFSYMKGLRIRPQETRVAPIWARCE